MPKNSHKAETSTAEIIWDEQGQPLSNTFDDVYFSTANGLDESRHVFLKPNNLNSRWNTLHKDQNFTITETGFGTGLNFLATWQAWNASPSQGQLHFISIEKHPIKLNDLKRALQLWPELEHLSKHIIASYPPQPSTGVHRINFSGQQDAIKSISLTLIFSDIEDALTELLPCADIENSANKQSPRLGEKTFIVDAWYLDGFMPSKNPEMWSARLFAAMHRLSDTGSTFATFTAASAIRKGLLSVGFKCIKQSGYGKKREMLSGVIDPETLNRLRSLSKNTKDSSTEKNDKKNPKPAHKHSIQKHQATWVLQSGENSSKHINTEPKNIHIAIVGAGIAGAHTAYVLAMRGYRVSVFDKSEIASQASGNLQGAVYTKPSVNKGALNDFNQLAQSYADHFYEQHRIYRHAGTQCGVLHLANRDNNTQQLKDYFEHFKENEGFYRWVHKEKSQTISGLRLNHDGLLIKKAGWLNPLRMCEILLSHPNIQLHKNTAITRLERINDTWQLFNNSEILIRAHICIVANATDAQKFTQCAPLPLKKIRGQVTHIESTAPLTALKTVICGEGYIAPSEQKGGKHIHCIGASFNLNEHTLELTKQDELKNIEQLKNISPALNHTPLTLDSAQAGRVGFRATTPDYFPICGPIPKWDETANRFVFLTKKANAKVEHCGDYEQGLYCNLGFGSRGLAYAPLCAELIASLIDGGCLPMVRNTYQHLSPARFLIRSLMRGKRPDYSL